MEAIKAAGGPDMKALSKKAGLSPGYIHAVLKQGRTPSIENFLAIADAAGVEPAWLLFGDERFRLKYPVVGRLTDRETWEATPGGKSATAAFEPGPDAAHMIVIEVATDAAAPAYRPGDVLYCARAEGRNLHNLIVGRDCVVVTRDGERLIKHVLSGRRPGTYTLRSIINPVAESIENVVLDWAAPIEWIRRGRP